MAKKKSKAAPAAKKVAQKTAKKAVKKSAPKVSAKAAKTPAKKAAPKSLKSAPKKANSKKAATPKKAPATTTKKAAKPRTTVKKVFNDAVAAVKNAISNVADTIAPNKVGTAAPAIALQATGGKEIDLSTLKGKKVVLYFYPKDDTPGCTLEGQDFTRLHNEFKSANTEVYGVSRDSVQSHDKFKAKQKYSIDLLSDSDEKLCNAYGVIKMKNMYGKKVRGIERSTFVLDTEGKIVKEWRSVSVPGHADEVLKFVKSI